MGTSPDLVSETEDHPAEKQSRGHRRGCTRVGPESVQASNITPHRHDFFLFFGLLVGPAAGASLLVCLRPLLLLGGKVLTLSPI